MTRHGFSYFHNAPLYATLNRTSSPHFLVAPSGPSRMNSLSQSQWNLDVWRTASVTESMSIPSSDVVARCATMESSIQAFPNQTAPPRAGQACSTEKDGSSQPAVIRIPSTVGRYSSKKSTPFQQAMQRNSYVSTQHNAVRRVAVAEDRPTTEATPTSIGLMSCSGTFAPDVLDDLSSSFAEFSISTLSPAVVSDDTAPSVHVSSSVLPTVDISSSSLPPFFTHEPECKTQNSVPPQEIQDDAAHISEAMSFAQEHASLMREPDASLEQENHGAQASAEEFSHNGSIMSFKPSAGEGDIAQSHSNAENILSFTSESLAVSAKLGDRISVIPQSAALQSHEDNRNVTPTPNVFEEEICEDIRQASVVSDVDNYLNDFSEEEFGDDARLSSLVSEALSGSVYEEEFGEDNRWSSFVSDAEFSEDARRASSFIRHVSNISGDGRLEVKRPDRESDCSCATRSPCPSHESRSDADYRINAPACFSGLVASTNGLHEAGPHAAWDEDALMSPGVMEMASGTNRTGASLPGGACDMPRGEHDPDQEPGRESHSKSRKSRPKRKNSGGIFYPPGLFGVEQAVKFARQTAQTSGSDSVNTRSSAQSEDSARAHKLAAGRRAARISSAFMATCTHLLEESVRRHQIALENARAKAAALSWDTVQSGDAVIKETELHALHAAAAEIDSSQDNTTFEFRPYSLEEANAYAEERRKEAKAQALEQRQHLQIKRRQVNNQASAAGSSAYRNAYLAVLKVSVNAHRVVLRAVQNLIAHSSGTMEDQQPILTHVLSVDPSQNEKRHRASGRSAGLAA